MRPQAWNVALIAAFVLVLASGCGQAPPTTGPSDAGGDAGDEPASSDLVQPVGGDLRLGEPWYLVGGTLENRTTSEVTLTFEDTTVAGQGPINSYSAQYEAGPDGSLEIGPLATTRMAGPQDEMDAEAELLGLLDRADGYTTVAGGELYLFDGDVNVLVYATTPAPDDLVISDETQALAAEVVGMAEDDAQATVEAADHVWRVVARDGTSFPVTEDYSVTRINATIDDGVVTETWIG